MLLTENLNEHFCIVLSKIPIFVMPFIITPNGLEISRIVKIFILNSFFVSVKWVIEKIVFIFSVRLFLTMVFYLN